MNEITGKVLTGLAVIGILFVLRYVVIMQVENVPQSYGRRGTVTVDPNADLLAEPSGPRPAAKPSATLTASPVQPMAAPVKIASALEITCTQGSVSKCNAAAKTLAQNWSIPDNRVEAERWFEHTCRAGSREGCRSLLVLAKTYASTQGAETPKAWSVLFRTCEIGYPKGCVELIAHHVKQAQAGVDVEHNVMNAYSTLERLCHASFPDTSNLCSKERTRFDELLARGVKGFDRKRAALLRKELADGEREGNYMLPNEARREWLTDP